METTQKVIDSSDEYNELYSLIMGSNNQVNDEYKDIINQKFEDGATPLIYATKNNKSTAVAHLLMLMQMLLSKIM